MEAITPQSLVRLAPGAARPRNGSLIDTQAFLAAIREEGGYQPILAIQGTAHGDAKTVKASQGRHIVVSTNRAGLCIALVNGHVDDRPVYAGLGLARGDAWLIAHHVTIQRQRGFEAPLAELLAPKGHVVALRRWLVDKPMNYFDTTKYARRVADRAYLPSYNKASWIDLFNLFAEDPSIDVLSLAFRAQKIISGGGLKAAGNGQRRLKVMRRPDALMHASSQIFWAAADLAGNSGLHHNLTPFVGKL